MNINPDRPKIWGFQALSIVHSAILFAQSAWAVEYTDCTSAEG